MHTYIHTVGVSLVVQGVSVPNNSLVDVDDVLYTENNDIPLNVYRVNHYKALLCVTDLVKCCRIQRIGNWYFPNGSAVRDINLDRIYSKQLVTFRSIRGQNEFRSGHQFYGSVRLFRRYSTSIRGLFRCELPDANNVTQTLYANIGENNYKH